MQQLKRKNLITLLLSTAMCFGVFTIAFPCAAYAQKSGSLEDRLKAQEKKLNQIRKEIDQRRAKAKELGRAETNVLKKLSGIEKEIDLSEKLLKELGNREALLTEQIDSLKARVGWEGDALVEQEERLATRLRQLYKREPHFRWELLLGSESVHAMLQRYKFLRMVAEWDAKLVREVRNRKETLEHEQAVLTETLADVASLKAAKSEESKQLKGKKNTRLSMLKRIRGEKSRHTKAIQDLEKAQAELQNLIGSLEKKRLEESSYLEDLGDFAKLKGRLIRPVAGKVIRSFGKNRHPKFGTVTFNSGIDIQAQPGTPIRAVANGVVEFMDWIAGYGKCIILNHGGGYYTLYAHLSDLFVQQNQRVSGGEVIAEVGDSGSLEGFSCHFEIRKAKKALNPLDWFAKK